MGRSAFNHGDVFARMSISGQVFDLITCHLVQFSTKFHTVLFLIILFLTNWS